MLTGRNEIFTDVEVITSENIISVLQDALNTHETSNVADINFLIEYEKGNQPLVRVKKYRPEINVNCVDNLANEISTFKQGFMWGNPITLVQRGSEDSGNDDEGKAIALLNECFEAENLKAKTQQLASYVEITGVGYTFLDLKADYVDGDSYFTYDVLDPRYTFIVKSSKLGHKPMLGVTYTVDKNGNKYFTCFTNDLRFEVFNTLTITNGQINENKWYEGIRSGEINPFGIIPIVEWVRAYDRMGCFERQIDDMNTLNLLESDFGNDVDQNTQAIWHGNDITFPVDDDGEVIKPKANDWLLTYSPENGKSPFVNPLSISYDYNGMLNNIITKRQLILQKCNVPQRNDNSGGSTGIAMSDATGWSNAEVEANAHQGIQEQSKMLEVKIALEIIKRSPDIDSDNPLLKLRYSDVKPNVKRQKTYEMNTKINAFATGVSHGIDYKSMLQVINLFDDPQQVAEDSEDTMKMYIASVFKLNENVPEGGEGERKPNADRTMQDESDQTNNSPMLD